MVGQRKVICFLAKVVSGTGSVEKQRLQADDIRHAFRAEQLLLCCLFVDCARVAFISISRNLWRVEAIPKTPSNEIAETQVDKGHVHPLLSLASLDSFPYLKLPSPGHAPVAEQEVSGR